MECYYVYVWALKNFQKLGTKGKKIIIIGDSAGGNLAASVTLKAITDGIRIPDALFLIYPALYMHFVPSPSRLLSIIDPLLPTKTILECLKAYVPSENNLLDNPFLSPAIASDELLKKFPNSIFILTGSFDPLFDDSIFFTKRLLNIHKKVRLKIFDEFPHGFLNLATFPQYGKEMKESIQFISNWIQQYLKDN
jgi:hormone-sensitive lipase